MEPWHDRDDWWEALADSLFTTDHWARTALEVDGLLARSAPAEGADVLDLCCGPGRHSLELARRGFSVTGVDRTRAFLARARSWAEAEGLEVELVRDDMRTFRRPGAFDLAVNLYTSFGYFEDPGDDREVIDNLFSSLRPGGRLVLEMMGREVLARVWQDRRWERVGDRSYLLQESRVSPDWTWMESLWILVGPDGTRELPLSHRLYGASDLSGLLKRAGFVDVRIFGALDGRPYDHEAQRLVVMGTRPPGTGPLPSDGDSTSGLPEVAPPSHTETETGA